MMIEPTRLPYTRPPETDESLRGYLLSLAIDNGYPSLARLMDICGTPKSRPTSFDCFDLDPLAKLIAQPEETLQRLKFQPVAKTSRIFLGETIPSFLISRRRMKFCPTCIDEAPHLKTSFNALWDLQLSVACQKHGTYLVSECEICKKSPSWYTTPWYQCKCGHDLRKTQPKKTDSRVASFSHLLTHIFTSEPKPLPGHLPKELARIAPGDLLRAVAIIGCWANGMVEGYISHRLEQLSSDQRIDLLRKANEVFTNWPSNFHTFLGQCRGLAPQAKSSSLMNREFGALFDTLMYKVRDHNSEFIRDELKKYGESLSLQEGVQDLDNTSLVNLSKETGIGISALRKMFDQGTIKIFKEKRGYKKDRYFICENDLKALRKKLSDNITLQEVSEILGLGIKTTSRLRDEGIFKADPTNLSDGRCGSMYSKKEVEGLLDAIARKAVHKKKLPSTQYQKISEAMSMYCINGLTRKEFLNSIISGSLNAYKHVSSPKLDGIFIDRKEVKEFVLSKINSNKDLISPERASTEFGITEKHIIKLAKSKRVTSKILSHGARKYRLVSRKSITRSTGKSTSMP